MKKGWALFLQRWKSIPRTALLFSCLFFVAIAIIAFDLAEKWLQPTAFVEPFQVALVDEERSFETRMIVRQFQEAKELSNVLTFVDVEKRVANEMLTKGEVVAILIVPNSFTKDLRIGRNTPLIVEIGSERSVEAMLFVEMMRSGTNLINASQTAINTTYEYLQDWGLSGDRLQHKTNEAIVYFSLKLLKRGELIEQEMRSATGDYTWSEYYIASLLIVLPFLGSIAIQPMVSLSRKNEVFKRLKSINIGALPLVMSTFYIFLVVGTIQLLILGGIVFFLGSMNRWLDLILLMNIALFLSAYLSFFTIFKGLSAIFSTVVGGVLIVVGGLLIPLPLLPEWVQAFEGISPFYWLHQVILERSFAGVFVIMSMSVLLLLVASIIEKKRMGC